MRKKIDRIKVKEDNLEKSDRTNNKPSRLLRRFIKLNNLVPFDAHIDFYEHDYEINSGNDMLFVENDYLFFNLHWANKHNLQRYPKLFRYLSLIAKTNGIAWMDAFRNFKNVREFMRIFIEITKSYQEIHNQTEKQIKFSHETGNQFLIKSSEFRWEEKLFNITYGSSSFRAAESERKYPGLPKRLFDSVKGFLSVSVNENHRGIVSFGSLLHVIQGTDFRRLRNCVVCSSIFWAYRLNAKFCSKKCSNVHHQRLYQTENRETINSKRKENYQYKRRKKNNGTL